MQDKDSLFKINDEIDVISILFVTLKNLNLFISVFLAAFFISVIYYLSSTKIYQSKSLIEIQNDTNIAASQAFNPLAISNNSINAEIEIYKSKFTIEDVIRDLKENYPDQIETSFPKISNNLRISDDKNSLISISFSSDNEELTPIILNKLNDEYIKDRKNFKKQSSAAARQYISLELPKVKSLLSQAEENLNSFKLSTNSTDVIFDAQTRSTQLNDLKKRIDEINFKELELKEFYKTSHPIYMTLSDQKSLVESQIAEIEKDLPQVPSRQRKIENLKREVKIYSDVIQNLTAQDINLSLSEASSSSNVRIINSASDPIQIAPSYNVLIIFPLAAFILFFVIQNLRYFLNNTITNPDALSDFVGKDRVIGELPLIDNINKIDSKEHAHSLADELLHKTVYELTDPDKNYSSILFTSSRKNVGKTEVSKKIYKMLVSEGKKVCLLDLDFRKGGVKKSEDGQATIFSSYEDFFKSLDESFQDKSIEIPSLKVDSIPSFFKSESFVSFINELKNNYDFVLCDTPPWSLFVDAKIVSKSFDHVIYIAGSDITTFKDIEIFESEFSRNESISYFFNKFNFFYNIFGLSYQYPYYSNNYYYNYENYRLTEKKGKIRSIFEWGLKKIKGFF